MATITIRQLDDAVYDRLKAQARANHRSLEAEARHLIWEQLLPAAEEPARPSREERAQAVADFLERIEALHARSMPRDEPLPDSSQMIREMRDEE